MITRTKLAATTTLGLVLGLAVVTMGLGGGDESRPNPVDPVTVSGTIADPATGRRQIAGLGVVEPRSGEVDLAGLMPGVISVIHVEEGDSVRKDQILAELVNDDLKAKVAQAKAQLTIRKAEFDRVRNGAREQEIAQAEAQLKQDEGALSLLKLQFDRRKKLARSGAVSQEAFNTAESALIAGQQRRDASAQALSLLVEGSRSEDVMASGAQVELAQHQLEEAEAALGKSYIRASTDGIVLRLYREPGEALSTQPASPIIQIGDTSRLVVRAQIDEADIGMLKVGQKATITAQALEGKSLEGVVRRISPRVGAKTIQAGTPTEKRDARVLDVLIDLQPEAKLPISLRVDVFIDVGDGSGEPSTPAESKEGAPAATLQEGVAAPDGSAIAGADRPMPMSPIVEIMEFGDKVASIAPSPAARDALARIHPEIAPSALPRFSEPAGLESAGTEPEFDLFAPPSLSRLTEVSRFGSHPELDPLARQAEAFVVVEHGPHPQIDPQDRIRPIVVGAAADLSPIEAASRTVVASAEEPAAPDLSTWSLRTTP